MKIRKKARRLEEIMDTPRHVPIDYDEMLVRQRILKNLLPYLEEVTQRSQGRAKSERLQSLREHEIFMSVSAKSSSNAKSCVERTELSCGTSTVIADVTGSNDQEQTVSLRVYDDCSSIFQNGYVKSPKSNSDTSVANTNSSKARPIDKQSPERSTSSTFPVPIVVYDEYSSSYICDHDCELCAPFLRYIKTVQCLSTLAHDNSDSDKEIRELIEMLLE